MSAAKSFDRIAEKPPEQEPSVQETGLVPKPEDSEEIRCLRQDEFALWDAFVDASPQGSVFTHSWWLQAVGGDTSVLACFRKGRIVAGIPLHNESYYGLKFCRLPKITPFWGVLLCPSKGKKAKVASEESGILKSLAGALKENKFFFQFFSTEFDNWLPFAWEGYRQTTRYTYRLAVHDLNSIWQEMAHSVRNQIRIAERNGITVQPCGPDQVFSLEEDTYRRQGLRIPHTSEYLERLYSAAKERNAGECLAAIDRDGKVHAASFYVWDAQITSALLMGNNTEMRNSGAASLLHWGMIQSAATKSKTYDFCGSFVEGIERFVRSFGGTRLPYHQISRFPKLLTAYLSCTGKV